MFSREPIIPHRVRRIRGSFSWIDHRLLSGGYLNAMSAEELLLYFFLVLVGDRNGISFYHYQTICHLLKMSPQQLEQARSGLIAQSLIAYHQGRYQVLALPEGKYRSSSSAALAEQRKISPAHRNQEESTAKSIAQIFEAIHQKYNKTT